MQQHDDAVVFGKGKLDEVQERDGSYFLVTRVDGTCGVTVYATPKEKIGMLLALIDALHSQLNTIDCGEEFCEVLQKFLDYLRQTPEPGDAPAEQPTESSCRLEDFVVRVPF